MSGRFGGSQYWSAGSGDSRLAINQLQQQGTIDEAAVDRFLGQHEVPIVEGRSFSGGRPTRYTLCNESSVCRVGW